jgi:hypothetical protein
MFTTTVSAIVLQAVAIATVSVSATSSGMRQDDSNQAGIIITHSEQKSPIQLSMGPDPGGKTGATVTPETTKTGQPTDEPSHQPGASAAASASARDSTDASTGPANSSEPLKPRDSTETRPTPTLPTAPSTSGQNR